jgi:hypothetical protein
VAQWKKELSADEVRFLVNWFVDTYGEDKFPQVWIPSKAEAVYSKIDEIKAGE